MERLPITFSCSVSSQLTDNTVPPTIHLIWLGSPLPARYLPGPASLAALNPDYTVTLWLDHPTPAPALPFPNIQIKDVGGEVWQCRDLLADCTNYAQRSDVLRLEIVQRYGGIYVGELRPVEYYYLSALFHFSLQMLTQLRCALSARCSRPPSSPTGRPTGPGRTGSTPGCSTGASSARPA